MLTGEIKNKIDGIWTMLWTEGSTNPLTNIEQITYLLFMKSLDEEEMIKENDAKLTGDVYESIFPVDKPYYRWHIFKDLGDNEEVYKKMTQEIFPFIKTLGTQEDRLTTETAFSKYMKEALFQINQPATLKRVITAIEELDLTNRDTSGDVYEHLLSKLATAGTNGQFRTPRHIIKMVVELMQPTLADTISDPAMGSAGFLVASSEYIRQNQNDGFFVSELAKHFNQDMFHGNDMDQTMLRIGAMNMMLHGVDNPKIAYRDSLGESNKEKDKYTLVLANPPFKGALDFEAAANDLLSMTKTKKTELLFLALILRTLKPGGRSAVIVPDGVLFGSSGAHKSIRKEIVEGQKLEAVISMPSGVFKPYAGVSTAILIFTKTNSGGTDNVWFYDMQNDGYSLDDKRSPLKDSDIPEIITRFHNREAEVTRQRTDQSFLVPVKEIISNDWDLSLNKYKKVIYEEVEYRTPLEIIEEIKSTDEEININLTELSKLLKGENILE